MAIHTTAIGTGTPLRRRLECLMSWAEDTKKNTSTNMLEVVFSVGANKLRGDRATEPGNKSSDTGATVCCPTVQCMEAEALKRALF